MIRIAVDAMGGDKGSQVVTRGVLDAARRSSSHYLLVGRPDEIEAELALSASRPKNIEIVAACEIIEMTENPVEAFRKKPDASVVVSAQLVKDGKADGFVTISNTGAAVAVSMMTLKRIKGVDRPAIATTLPTLNGKFVLLDAGATPDCDSNNLYEFALMGSAFSQKVHGVARPKLALLSIGEEDSKGNLLTKKAFALFKEEFGERCPFDFVGNIEGKDIYRGAVDVVVCDGFVGNTVLKTSEGIADMILKLIKEELYRSKLLTPLLIPFRPAFDRVRKRLDYSEHGGAPLLGVNGVCIIGHGRSNENAVANACLAAEKAVQNDLVETIRHRVTSAGSRGSNANIN